MLELNPKNMYHSFILRCTMEVNSKSSVRSGSGNNFLADINHRKPVHHVTYGDGFRFGIGILTAHLLIALILGGLAWALVIAFKLHN